MSNDLETVFRSFQTSLAAHRPDKDLAETSEAAAVPVTVVTGFLGAGKTTLLAALLRDPPEGQTVRAVVNDVGDLGLDPSLLVDGEALDVELSNGCGCCAINDDLADALERMARLQPSVLVLEASGITDPFAMAQIIEASPNLDLDRTVAVVDAVLVAGEHIGGGAVSGTRLDRLGPIIKRQLDAAQVVVLSRADMVEPSALDAALTAVAEWLPGRTITPSSLARPAHSVLLPGSVRGAALPSTTAAPHHNDPTHHVVARSFPQQTSVDRRSLEETLRGLPPSILRCKGVLRTDHGPVTIQATASDSEVAAIDSALVQIVAADDDGNGEHGPTLGRITIVSTEAAAAEQLAQTLGC